MLVEPRVAPPPGFVRTPADLLSEVVRRPWAAVDLHPGQPCLLDREAVDAARIHPCGGVLRCCDCGRPILVEPATCLGRVEDDLDEIDGGVHPRS